MKVSFDPRTRFFRLCVACTVAVVLMLSAASAVWALNDEFGGASYGTPTLPYTERIKALPDSWKAAGVVHASESPHHFGGRMIAGDMPQSTDLLVVVDGTMYQVPLPTAAYTVTPEAPERIGQYLLR